MWISKYKQISFSIHCTSIFSCHSLRTASNRNHLQTTRVLNVGFTFGCGDEDRPGARESEYIDVWIDTSLVRLHTVHQLQRGGELAHSQLLCNESTNISSFHL